MSARAGSSSTPTMTTEIDGVAAIDLRSEAGGLEASVVPGAGMVVCSLRHHGDELLGQRARPARLRRGARRRWASRCSTRGPTASRRTASRSPVAGSTWTGPRRRRAARFGGPCDARPALGRRTDGGSTDTRRRRRRARELRLRRPAGPDRGVPVPAPRRSTRPRCEGSTLSITTTVEATRGTPVPVAFGYHPYFRLPGTARGDWEVEIPVRERLLLDRADAADGRTRAGRDRGGPLGERTFDDAYAAPPQAAAVLDLGRAPPHRGAVRRGLPIRPGLRTRRRRRDRVRADDRAHQRARPRRAGVADPAARGTLRGAASGSPSRIRRNMAGAAP